MTSSARGRQLLTSVLFVAVALAALGLAGLSPLLAPAGSFPAAGALLGLAVVGSIAALHRPFLGPGLGLGTVVLPVVLLSFGSVPAGWVAGLTLVLAEILRRILEKRVPQPPPERRHRLRILAGAGRCALSTLGGGLVWALVHEHRPLYGLALSALAYLVLAALFDSLEGRLRQQEAETGLDRMWPLGLDAAGWGVGGALASSQASPLTSAVVLTSLALLSFEAARNALHRDALARRIYHLESLGRAGERISGKGNELADVADQIRSEVGKVIPFHWFHLEISGDDAQSFRAGPSGVLEAGRPRPGKSPPPLRGIHRRASWQLIDRELSVEGRSVGRLRLWCDPRLLEQEGLELLDLLLPQMAASLELAILDREAKRDALTDIAVRRVFDRALQETYEEAVAEGLSFAVVLLDLDHFKSINDTYGHDAGDAALVHVASILDDSARDQDLCCRYGGEEFALLLRETRGEAALTIADRLRLRIEASPVELPDRQLRLTASSGVAAFPELFVHGPTELLTLADAALYAAKRGGRNQCLLNLGRGNHRRLDGSLVRDESSQTGDQQDSTSPVPSV